MIIAVDFDGTVVEHKYPQIGKPIPFAIETLKQLQKEGHILLMWSVREGSLLQEAIDYLESNGVSYYAYNKNHPEEDPTKAPRKLDAEIFIDDRNVGGLPDWGLIYQAVQAAQSGGMTFADAVRTAYRPTSSRKRKKNFLIRLGEMFEKDGF